MEKSTEEVYHMILKDPLTLPDWSLLFGYSLTKESTGPDPIVSAERTKLDLPAQMTKKRDFFKLVRSQVLDDGTENAQEILIVATQRGNILFLRGDGRVAHICLPDLMFVDLIYAPK